MRELMVSFDRLWERDGLGLSISLGREDLSPALAELRDGETALAIEPGELQALITTRHVDRDGQRYWFGVLESRDAIQDISSAVRP